MEKRSTLLKIAAIVGTVLVGIPILAPIFFSIRRTIGSGMFEIDYLMPAELLPVVLLGSAVLIWAAWRAKMRLKFFAWTLAIGTLLVFAGQGIAIVTGMASGEVEPTPLLMAAVIGPIILYDLAVVAIFIGGILLVRDLYKAA